MKTPLTGSLKFISWILVFGILNMTAGCSYFKVVTVAIPADEQPDGLFKQSKELILHYEDNAWILESPAVSDRKLTGIAKRDYVSVYQKKIDPKIPNQYKAWKQSILLKEVHIYATELVWLPESYVSVPFSGIQKIELYEKDRTTTRLSHILSGIIIMSVIIGVIAIATNPPDSGYGM
jgi:hypothetical protein